MDQGHVQDHGAGWWTSGVQDYHGPPKNIFLMIILFLALKYYKKKNCKQLLTLTVEESSGEVKLYIGDRLMKEYKKVSCFSNYVFILYIRL